MQLFFEVDPELAELYSRVNIAHIPLKTRFQIICDNFNNQGGYLRQNLPSFKSHFQSRKIPIWRSLIELINSAEFSGPSEMIIKLRKYSHTHPISDKYLLKRFQVENQQSNQLILLQTFEEILQQIQTTKQLSNFMENCDFLDFVEDIQQKIVVMIQKIAQNMNIEENKSLEFICIRNMINFSFNDLSQILTPIQLKTPRYNSVTTLILVQTSKLTDQDIISIQQNFHSIVYLDISKCQNIKNIGNDGVSEQLMQWNTLKTLICYDMPFLLKLCIMGVHIQNINIDGCHILKVFLADCPNLARISAQKVPNLPYAYLAIHILMETETLLSGDSCNDLFNSISNQSSEQQKQKYLTLEERLLVCHAQLLKRGLNSSESSLSISIFNKMKMEKYNIQKSAYLIKVASNLQIWNTEDINYQNYATVLLKNKHIKNLKLGGTEGLLVNTLVIGKIIQSLNYVIQNNSTNTNEGKISSISNQNQLKNYFKTIQSLDLSLISQFLNKDKDLETVGIIVQSLFGQNKLNIKMTNENNKNNKQAINHFGTLIIKNLGDCDNDRGFEKLFSNLQKPQQLYLKELNLSNSFFCSKPKNLQSLVTFLSQSEQGSVQHLILRQCKLSDQTMEKLAEGLGKSKSLVMLDLSENLLEYKSMQYILQACNSNPKIQKLILDGNKALTFYNMSLIGDKFKNIISLSIQDCESLGQGDWQIISEWLSDKDNCILQQLDISYNKLKSSTIEIISQGLWHCYSLLELRVNGIIQQNIDKKEDIRLLLSQENCMLSYLELGSNDIGDDSLAYLENKIIEMPIRVLKIQNDQTFKEGSLKNFMLAARESKFLTELQIDKLDQLTSKEMQDIFQILQDHMSQNLYQKHKNYQNQYQELQNISFIRQNSSNNRKIYYRETGGVYKMGLSIDGGGMRGIIPAYMIRKLCQLVDRDVHEIFDIVGGTSIGGILALGLTGTQDGVRPVADYNEIVNIFEKHGSRIFPYSAVNYAKSLFTNQYGSEGLEQVCMEYFNITKLSDVMENTNVIIPAVYRAKMNKKSSTKIFKSKNARFNKNKDFYMRDVARATSAAPTYFSSAEIKNVTQTKHYSLLDGGMGLNNPSILVLNDLKKESENDGNDGNYFLLSLGTGECQGKQEVSQNAGIFTSIKEIFNSFSSAGTDFIDEILEQTYPGKYLRAQPILNIHNDRAKLDSTDAKILDLYKKAAEDEAIKQFTNENQIFGQFQDRSLIEWLSENTARKKDFI